MKFPMMILVRIGLGFTFLIIGFMISLDPNGWAILIQPWIRDLIPYSTDEMMFAIAGFDMAIGILLILGIWTWLASLLGALHIIGVLIVTGITEITIRDIGLLAAAITLSIETAPKEWHLFTDVKK